MIKEKKVKSNNPFLKKIIYIKNNKEIGYLEYLLIYDRIEIQNIFVSDDYRNQKIATKLMQELINLANRENIINITLEVDIKNKYAIKLYNNFNFKIVAKREKYYGQNDGLLMEKVMK